MPHVAQNFSLLSRYAFACQTAARAGQQPPPSILFILRHPEILFKNPTRIFGILILVIPLSLVLGHWSFPTGASHLHPAFRIVPTTLSGPLHPSLPPIPWFI